ncbi:MAG: hypothetical protein L6R42_011429 [Xanthoria sp. 1 TBL-2021]|nr:MAG: hypothetical protein L6R42_011429 [Xanthoria sp. 1 TBL-2021]
MGTSEHLAVANSSSVQSSDPIGQSSTADTAVEAKGISFRRPLAGDVCRGPVYPGNQSDWKYPAYAWYRHDPYLRVYDPQPTPIPAVTEYGPPARPESPSEQLLASTEDGNSAAGEDATTPSIPNTLPANDTAMGSVATTVENTDSVIDPVKIPLPTSEVESKDNGVSSTPTDSNTMSTTVAPAATTDTAIESTAMIDKDIYSVNVPVNTPLPTSEVESKESGVSTIPIDSNTISATIALDTTNTITTTTTTTTTTNPPAPPSSQPPAPTTITTTNPELKAALTELKNEILTEMKELLHSNSKIGDLGSRTVTGTHNMPPRRRTSHSLLFRGFQAFRGSELDLEEV